MGREYQEATPKVRVYHEYVPHFSESLYLITCGIERCSSNESFGPKKRPDWHLHMILSGEGDVEVGENRYHLQAGQMFLVKPGESIHYCADQANPWTYCWVVFGGMNSAMYMDQAGFVKGVNTSANLVDPKHFSSLTNELLDHTESDLSGGLWRFSLLNQIISMTIKLNRTSVSGAAVRLHTATDYINYALEYIEQNYAHAKVTDISASIGIDHNSFVNLFKKTTGISPTKYLSRVRMSKSAQLLLNTNMTISEVAKQIGYENPLTFSHCFKREFNASPRKYRSLHKSAD